MERRNYMYLNSPSFSLVFGIPLVYSHHVCPISVSFPFDYRTSLYADWGDLKKRVPFLYFITGKWVLESTTTH